MTTKALNEEKKKLFLFDKNVVYFGRSGYIFTPKSQIKKFNSNSIVYYVH